MLRHLIIRTIAEDEQAIPDILDFLAYERKRKKKLVEDFNVNLSKAHLALTKATYKKGELNSDHFVDREVEAFFHKYKDEKGVGHLFMKLEELNPGKKEDKGFYNDED
jgi:hypothetical protein